MQHEQASRASRVVSTRPVTFIVAAVLAAGCASAADREIPAVVIPSHPSTTVAAVADPSVDPGSELLAALRATGDYRFETTVMVDDAVTRFVSGSVSGGAWQAKVDVDGATTEYLKTDEGAWVRSIADLWVPGDVAVSIPMLLDVFGAVTPSGILGWEAVDGGLELHARYPGASVGAPEIDEVDVDVTIGDGVIRRVRYQVPDGEQTAEVVTVISEVGTVGPIDSPRSDDRGETTRPIEGDSVDG